MPRPSAPVVVAVLVAVGATAAGVALAARSGGYAPERTATGRVTVETGVLLPAGTYASDYCGSYGNVATQQGYVFRARLAGGETLTLADSLARDEGAQDARRVTLVVDGPRGRYAWGPGLGGAVALGAGLLSADVDARLVGAQGDSAALRARFACRPRVAPKADR